MSPAGHWIDQLTWRLQIELYTEVGCNGAPDMPAARDLNATLGFSTGAWRFRIAMLKAPELPPLRIVQCEDPQGRDWPDSVDIVWFQ